MVESPKLIALRARAAALHAQLSPHEIRWRDRQVFLALKGYMLRPRYRPAWKPTWETDKSHHPNEFEDYYSLPPRDHLIDATRVNDGKLVYVKRVATGDTESQIIMKFSSPASRLDPRNHCVPVLDYFTDDEDSSISYIVMPFLRPVDYPPLETINDVVDFVSQLMEGLIFMHEQGVAHRDCSEKNLLMDADSLFPKGFHPVRMDNLPDGRRSATQLSRRAARVTYYYVDFGISVFIPPDKQPKLALGGYGRDQDVPELSFEVPYDPFKVDIFILGNTFRREIYEVGSAYCLVGGDD
ncbi:hypothetical protein PHLCEN_2v10472 [Hermanssonia centrifuga]|uniref:Protein kinase domain-containing protein n=1 Tax=Hermanssonia centrifuga TaxID=98765 RepID=A0A2R6NMD5_9APHY|nr:hypothetical protein PHLCEN_2v10472 [Hermanssonia centrifuga]